MIDKTDYNQYFRKDKLPHIWCPGCSYGVITKALIKAIEKTGWSKDDVACVSGIGCSSRLPGYLDFNTIHTIHGRAPAFATGIKLANPDLNVVTITGDGDISAIGGNHFIHACRRNIDITIIIFNNNIYGMTGGQYSPTTPQGAYATTAPYTMFENNFDISSLAINTGATFVARTTAFHLPQMATLIHKALTHKGLSVVEIISDCSVEYSRPNKLGKPSVVLNSFKDKALPLEKAEGKTEEELQGRIITGVLHHDTTKKEYSQEYDKLIERVKKTN